MSWKVTTQANLKFQDMERNHKAVSKKERRNTHTHTHTHTHTAFELTSLLHCRNRASRVKHATEQKTVPQRAANKVRGTKTRQSALSKRIWAAPLRLQWDRFFNSSLLDVIHQRWQMWHDSSAWEAAVTKERKLLAAQCVTRGRLSIQKLIFKSSDVVVSWKSSNKVYRPLFYCSIKNSN